VQVGVGRVDAHQGLGEQGAGQQQPEPEAEAAVPAQQQATTHERGGEAHRVQGLHAEQQDVSEICQ